jgi:hypothetical protein
MYGLLAPMLRRGHLNAESVKPSFESLYRLTTGTAEGELSRINSYDSHSKSPPKL